MGFDHSVMAAVQSLYQVFGQAADTFFLCLTFLGEETMFLLMMPAVYWCFDKKLGEYLLLSLYASMSLNGLLKDLFRRPRPFLDPAFSDLRYVRIDNGLVDTVNLRSSFSFPSGHSQLAAALFGGLALWKRRTAVTLVCALLILGVMASRVYLGVHFPADVLAGAALSLLLIFILYKLFHRFYERKLLLFGIVLLLSFSTLFLDFTADTLKTVSLGVGAFIGMALDLRTLQFKVDGSGGKRLLRLLLGFALLMGLRLGLKALFPETLFFDGLRYGILGLTALYLWPLAFTKLRL